MSPVISGATSSYTVIVWTALMLLSQSSVQAVYVRSTPVASAAFNVHDGCFFPRYDHVRIALSDSMVDPYVGSCVIRCASH